MTLLLISLCLKLCCVIIILCYYAFPGFDVLSLILLYLFQASFVTYLLVGQYI